MYTEVPFAHRAGALYLGALYNPVSPLPKLVFISNIAAPYQVKFCYALAEYFDTRFWFYEQRNAHAALFWEVPLGDRCAVIPGVQGKLSGKYRTRAHLRWLDAFDPDIVMLGGFSIPANYLAYRWAKRHGKKTIVLTELSRNATGEARNAGSIWKIIRTLYRSVDAVFTLTEEATVQFRDALGFGGKVIPARYPADLRPYFIHPLRCASPSLTLLFANRLTPAYNPLEALRIFAEARRSAPDLRLHMNALGELRGECERLIKELGIEEEVHFLDEIQSWQDLHEEYRRCDVLLFPAKFSTGNFTIYEAMASGMGLIISDAVLANGQAVRNGENGFRLPLSRAAFVDAILRYAGEPGLLPQHGAQNREWVRQFGMEETAALYRTLIHQCL